MSENLNRGNIAALVGGQYGSEGKGSIAGYLADKYHIHVRVGSPNAGHTFYWNGEKHVQRSIPCGWINPNAIIVIGRGALVDIEQFLIELKIIENYYPDFKRRLKIDTHAGVLSERFHKQEGGVDGEMHHRIGSTGEGVGPARMARLERNPDTFSLFYEVASQHGLEECLLENTPMFLYTMNHSGFRIMIEGTQGSALSLLHSYWPYCTSIDTNAAQMLADVGIAPSHLNDVIMVCRTYPIRVAGNSGPMKGEITWEELGNRIGKNVAEKTTVTKKIRRVAEWDRDLFNTSCMLNNPTQIALMFADYIDPDLFEVNDVNKIINSPTLSKFIRSSGIIDYIHKHSCDLSYIATGPQTVVDVRGVFNV